MDDIPDAISDYQTSLSMNSLQSQTCQIVTAATLVNGTVPTQLTPAPCMFTVRLRLGYLLRETNPSTAIGLFQEVLQIDPQRLGVNTLIAETYVIEAQQATDPPAQAAGLRECHRCVSGGAGAFSRNAAEHRADRRPGEQLESPLGAGRSLRSDGAEQSGKERTAIIFAGDAVAQ